MTLEVSPGAWTGSADTSKSRSHHQPAPPQDVTSTFYRFLIFFGLALYFMPVGLRVAIESGAYEMQPGARVFVYDRTETVGALAAEGWELRRTR